MLGNPQFHPKKLYTAHVDIYSLKTQPVRVSQTKGNHYLMPQILVSVRNGARNFEQSGCLLAPAAGHARVHNARHSAICRPARPPARPGQARGSVITPEGRPASPGASCRGGVLAGLGRKESGRLTRREKNSAGETVSKDLFNM